MDIVNKIPDANDKEKTMIFSSYFSFKKIKKYPIKVDIPEIVVSNRGNKLIILYFMKRISYLFYLNHLFNILIYFWCK